MDDRSGHLGHVRELERLRLLRTEHRHFWVRVGVALVAVIITTSLPVALPAVATLSSALLILFPIVARALERDARRDRLRAITRVATVFYVGIGTLWVILLAPNESGLAVAIAAPTLAAAATLGLRPALAATLLLVAAQVAAEYLRVTTFGFAFTPLPVGLELAGVVGIGLITGLGTEALRTAHRASIRLRRAQALLTDLAPQIAGSLDEEEALRRIVAAAVELTRGEGGDISVRDPESGAYRIRAIVNMSADLAGREMPAGQGIAHLVHERGETVVVAGDELLAALPDFFREQSLASAIGTPVRIGTEIVAVPVVWTRDRSRRFDGVDRLGLESLATLATTALANARLYAGVELQRRRLRLLHDVRDIVGSSLELDTILRRALEQLGDAFGMNRSFVLLADEGARMLQLRAHHGPPLEPGSVAEIGIAVDRGLSATAFRERRIVNVPDVVAYPGYTSTAADTRSEIALPLVAADQAVGVLLVSSSRLGAFVPDDEQLLALFSGELSVAVANARAYGAQREAAIRDDLTGLYNHRYFREMLDHELAVAERHATPLSLLFIDLDDLKRINDHYGHAAGDLAIVRMAVLMSRGRRRTDVAARIGGEEFALLTPETAHADALIIAEQLRAAAAAETIELASSRIGFTASVGVATYPRCATDSRELRRAADMAMYEAKRGGRNRVVGAPA
ncbi:MAG: diguanylate cyclase, partial [Candidatus Limnocylindria bacterium]